MTPSDQKQTITNQLSPLRREVLKKVVFHQRKQQLPTDRVFESPRVVAFFVALLIVVMGTLWVWSFWNWTFNSLLFIGSGGVLVLALIGAVADTVSKKLGLEYGKPFQPNVREATEALWKEVDSMSDVDLLFEDRLLRKPSSPVRHVTQPRLTLNLGFLPLIVLTIGCFGLCPSRTAHVAKWNSEYPSSAQAMEAAGTHFTNLGFFSILESDSEHSGSFGILNNVWIIKGPPDN